MDRHGLVETAAAVLLAAVIGCSSSDSEPNSKPPGVTPPAMMAPIGGTGTTPGAMPGGSATPGTGIPGMPAMPSAGAPAPGGTAGQPAPGMTGAPVAGSTPPPMMTDMPMAGSGAPPTPHEGETCLKPGSGEYTEPGPYQVGMMDIDLGMIQMTQNSGKFTIFYPMPLEDSCPHPIVAWGNGTTVMGSGTYAFFNSNAASWGMVVAASHEDNTGSGNFHKAGLDWLLKQNEDSSSMFFNKLSTRAGVSGHSQGGFGSTAASNHPNVEAQVAVGAAGRSTAKIAALTLTGTEDIVMNPASLVTNAQGKAFVASWEGGDHVGTETIAGYLGRDPGTMQMQRLYAAWFRCFLADDSKACAMFEGGAPDGCGICKDTGWAVLASKNM